jgi:hypothetical protein
VDKAFSLFAEDGLKGAAAPCAVHRAVFRPPGIPAVEIAEFHAETIVYSCFPFYPFPADPVHRFPVVILCSLMYESPC